MIRTHSRYVIVGAGIHGLSTAWHLARDLRARGLGTGEDILVLDKREAGAGASGIACGTVRNNYFQPAMREFEVVPGAGHPDHRLAGQEPPDVSAAWRTPTFRAPSVTPELCGDPSRLGSSKNGYLVLNSEPGPGSCHQASIPAQKSG